MSPCGRDEKTNDHAEQTQSNANLKKQLRSQIVSCMAVTNSRNIELDQGMNYP